ncbi:hypothetical protein LEP1GSC115_3746 [Leptospira interrogans serovar Australis str. 200703203]|uniref:Uncharacterized protein n=1 Tax=Leptospira interrogans serovar Australis str. 200703203 TaxID=1085541 RepID=N1UQY4_LEPIR|nr:hypothetical protein LEP1GSC115_3746 [Leptospira interrogans serovar Australis str. 200703203]
MFRLKSEWNSTGLSSASTVEQTPVKYMKDSFFRTPETKCDPNPQETFKKKNVIEALNPEIMSKEEYKKSFVRNRFQIIFPVRKKNLIRIL